jgi:hypothetical protein
VCVCTCACCAALPTVRAALLLPGLDVANFTEPKVANLTGILSVALNVSSEAIRIAAISNTFTAANTSAVQLDLVVGCRARSRRSSAPQFCNVMLPR